MGSFDCGQVLSNMEAFIKVQMQQR